MSHSRAYGLLNHEEWNSKEIFSNDRSSNIIDDKNFTSNNNRFNETFISIAFHFVRLVVYKLSTQGQFDILCIVQVR